MKTKRCKNLVLAILLLTISLPAHSQSGSRGGASGIPSSDYVLLKDLEGTTCDIKATSSFLKEYGLQDKVNQILSALFKIHPYMTYRIRKEMSQLTWCVTTSKLARINSVDKNSLLLSYDPEVQIAIRDIDQRKVYLDVNAFKKMKPNPLILGKDKKLEFNQAMLVIHETAHSFISKDKQDRNDTLRTITRSIYSNYAKSLEPQYSMVDLRTDLDAMIQATGSRAAFETTEFSRAFDRYLKSKSEADAAQLKANGYYYPTYFEVMVNDFGNANLISKPAFRDALFPQKYQVTNAIPARYRFDHNLSLFNQEILKADDALRHSITGSAGNITYFKKSNETPIDLDLQYPFGSCQIYRKAYFHYHSDSRDGVVLNAEFRLAVVPEFGARTEKAVSMEIAAAGRHHDRLVSQMLRLDPIYDFEKELPKANLKYNRALADLMQKIAAGYCDNSQATGPQYYY